MIKKNIEIISLFEDDRIEQFEYEDYKGGVIVTGYNGTKPFIKIPELIDGKAVIAFGESKIERSFTKPTIMLPKSFSVFDVSMFPINNIANPRLSTPYYRWFDDVYLAEGNESFVLENNILYSKDRKKLIYSFDRNWQEVVVPDYVENIAERAFSENITLTIPNNVKVLEGHPSGTFDLENNETFKN